MKFKNYKLLLILLLFPLAASAEIIGQSGLHTAAGLAGFSMETDVYVIAVRWINGFLSIFTMVATYFIITAGFNWMTSGGNVEKITAAKATLKSTVLGLIIALLSYSLVRYVMFALATTTGVPV